jgi:hypothetical protein
MHKLKLLAFTILTTSIFAEQTILVDPYYSPYMGANDLLCGEWALTKLEDYLHPNQTKKDTFSVIGRAIEQIAWAKVNTLTSMVQHEIFGHGYRLRELGVTPKGYTFYVYGGAATYFNVSDSFLVGNMLAVDVAGLEAEAILADVSKMNWMREGAIDGRLAITYFQAEQSVFFYTLITHLGRLKGNAPSPGNDVESYLSYLNATYPSNPTSIGNLTLWASFNWLDPMTWYSLFSWFYYIAEGASYKIPMIQLSESTRYLPNIKIGYAPYAPEAYLQNFFTINKKPLYGYIKGGKRSVGLGGIYDSLVEAKDFTLGLHFDAWLHRQFVSSANLEDYKKGRSVAAPNQKIFGAALSVTSRIKLFSHTSLFLELGGKTAGYLPGYPLSGALTARGGITLGHF